MNAKFIDDGLPESADFDESYREIRSTPPASHHRDWRAFDTSSRTARAIIAPKDVRFFQRMEAPDRQISSFWKFVLRRFPMLGKARA